MKVWLQVIPMSDSPGNYVYITDERESTNRIRFHSHTPIADLQDIIKQIETYIKDRK
jgi:hypothetical protein